MEIKKGKVKAVKKGQDDGLLKVNMKDVTIDSGKVVEEVIVKSELEKDNEATEFLSAIENIYKNGYDKGFTHGLILAFVAMSLTLLFVAQL